MDRLRRTLQAWNSGSTNRRILVGAFAAGSAGMMVHIATVGKDLLLAARFGRADEVDAFLIAYLVPSLCLSVLGSAFESGIVPLFVRKRELEGEAVAHAFFASAMAWASRFVLTACLLLAVTLPAWLPLVAQGFSSAKLATTIYYGYWLIPAVAIACLASFGTSLLNASERFWLAAFAPIAVPVVVSIALLAFSGTWGGMAIVAGTLAGLMAQVALVVWFLYERGGLILPRAVLGTAQVREGIGQYLPIVVGAALMAMNTFVDQAMAARFEPGSVAALSYARKIPSFVSAGLAAALGAAVLPHFARMSSQGDIDQLFQSVNRFCLLALAVTVPIALVTIGFSSELIAVVFERGRFGAADTAFIAPLQALYAIQIPFYVCATVAVRALSASGLNKRVLNIAIVNFLLNLTLTYTLSSILGPRGIALATSLVMMVSAAQIYGSVYGLHRKTAGMRNG